MKTTVNFYHFEQAFKSIRPNNFSYEGLKALFNWLEDCEDQTGEEIELDVIALCCDFTEYASLAEFQADYGSEYESIEDISEATTLIDIDIEENEEGEPDGPFIIQCF